MRIVLRNLFLDVFGILQLLFSPFQTVFIVSEYLLVVMIDFLNPSVKITLFFLKLELQILEFLWRMSLSFLLFCVHFLKHIVKFLSLL